MQDVLERLGIGTVRRRLRESLPSVLTAVSALLALLLLSPIAWIVLRALEVAPARAIDQVLSASTAQIVVNSLVLVGLVTVLSVLIGVPLAVLTVQTDLPFRRFWTVVAALPLVIPSYIGAFAFVSVTGTGSPLSNLLAPLGIGPVPELQGLWGTVLVLTLFTYPYVFLTTRASLQSFDGTVTEAARTLNHSRLQAFRHVTLPQIAPGIAAGALLTGLYTLSDFGTPMIMGYDVFTREIFIANDSFDRGFAALLSLLLLGLTLAILYGESRIGEDREGAHVASGDRDAGRVSLGAWKWPSLGFCSGIATLALAVPLGILLMWMLRSTTENVPSSYLFEWGLAWNSLGVAAAAAVASVLVALPIAYLSARSDSWLGSLPERATYVGYATPGVVVGLALVFLGLKYANALYQTVPLLVFAYVVRFVPQAVGTIESSVLQVDPRHVEAARSMGDTSFRSFVRVVLPQVMPGVVAGGALVFLTTIKELPATLMLRPFGFETFVTHIWEVQEGAYYGQAAVPALILVAVSGLSMLVILGGNRIDVT
jgi:iron(III) transport system permease protein